VISLIELALKACPHSSSVIALTLRVNTPCTYISVSAANSAFSLRWYRSNSSVRKRPAILRDAQFQLPHSRDEAPLVRAAAVSRVLVTALAPPRLQQLVHLALEDLLQGRLHHLSDRVGRLGQYRLHIHHCVTISSSHRVLLLFVFFLVESNLQEISLAFSFLQNYLDTTLLNEPAK
jgi:hypothetical protein